MRTTERNPEIKMIKHTLIARAIDLAVASTLVATMAAVMTTTAAAQAGDSFKQDFCVIGSVSVPQACPSTINPALAAKDGFMAVHMDNQKKSSAVAAYWRAQTLDPTTVGSVTARKEAP